MLYTIIFQFFKWMELRPFIRILVYVIVKQGTSEENISEKDSYRHPKVSWTCCSMLTFITEPMPILLSSLLYLLDAGSIQTTIISILYYMSFWTLWKYNIIYLSYSKSLFSPFPDSMRKRAFRVYNNSSPRCRRAFALVSWSCTRI